jgi:hypothetical protein
MYQCKLWNTASKLELICAIGVPIIMIYRLYLNFLCPGVSLSLGPQSLTWRAYVAVQERTAAGNRRAVQQLPARLNCIWRTSFSSKLQVLSLFAAGGDFNKNTAYPALHLFMIDHKQRGRLLLLTEQRRDGERSLAAAACSSLAQLQSASGIIWERSKCLLERV